MENWRPVKGYEGVYEVSDLGRIRSLPRTRSYIDRWNGKTTAKVGGRIMRPQKDSNGYRHVILSKGGEHNQVLIHRIVAEAFCEKPAGKNYVNHKDEDKANNKASNLEWCDQSYNMTYGSMEDKFRGPNNPQARLTQSDVDEIKARRVAGEMLKTIAADFGISLTHASNICRGQRWAHDRG